MKEKIKEPFKEVGIELAIDIHDTVMKTAVDLNKLVVDDYTAGLALDTLVIGLVSSIEHLAYMSTKGGEREDFVNLVKRFMEVDDNKLREVWDEMKTAEKFAPDIYQQ